MSFFVFYTFLSALVLVQCHEFSHEEIGPHNFTAIDKCGPLLKEIRKNRMHASLMPRVRHVDLVPEPGYEFLPRTVTAMRCNGFCPGRWSPMPTKTKPIRKIVHLQQEGNPQSRTCVAVEVHEHMACKCMCMHSEKDCKSSQEWIQVSCSCQCRDRETLKSRCEAQFGMEWYENDCSCACTQKLMDCRSGRKWSKEACACVPKSNH